MSHFFKSPVTIKVNCPGGILPTGTLVSLLAVLESLDIRCIQFGLRQCIYFKVDTSRLSLFYDTIGKTSIPFERDPDEHPNVVSSYPGAEIFNTHSWLSEGVYKDILDSMDFKPRLKININDHSQSFTPFFTGNINWIASDRAPHFWYLYLRLPKTNTILSWDEMVYTNDLMAYSRVLDEFLSDHPITRPDQAEPAVLFLKKRIKRSGWITREKEHELNLPGFTLPYYEGLNPYNNRFWLGIYQRNETYALSFLQDLCALSRESHIGQLCITPWKSIIIKGIEEKNKRSWEQLLDRHQINIRHALNELNFQLEDHSPDGLKLKKYLVHQFNTDDVRTHGICFGIKTRQKSEVFSSILISKRYLVHGFGFRILPVYDILVAKDFNPNERTEYKFSTGLFRYLLADQLMLCIDSYYRAQTITTVRNEPVKPVVSAAVPDSEPVYVLQCTRCLTLADPNPGRFAGSLDRELPEHLVCSVCDSDAGYFQKTDLASLEPALLSS